MPRALYVTVGGSPQPVIRAIERVAADHVVFVCSRDDADTGRKGTWTQVRGTGNVCTSKPGEPPDLPAIPIQVGLDPGRWEVLEVPADEPVETTRQIQTRISSDIERGITVVVDYTGGTKSMSAGAFLAAALENAELQLITGPRVDHVRVRDRMEHAVRLDTTGLAEVFAVRAARAAWLRHDYREAAHALDTLHRPTRDARCARALSLAFADWDDFRYADALEKLQHFGRHVPALMGPLGRLARSGTDRQPPDPLQGYDLWLAAERRAAGGRYDQAVLLLYRCFEWIGQWSLRVHHALDASGVVTDRVELADLGHLDHRSRRVFPLHTVWTALERLDGPMRETAKKTALPRMTYTQLRNDSVLAHGLNPLDEAQFRGFRDWLRQDVIGAFVAHAFGGKPPMSQLPATWPRFEE